MKDKLTVIFLLIFLSSSFVSYVYLFEEDFFFLEGEEINLEGDILETQVIGKEIKKIEKELEILRDILPYIPLVISTLSLGSYICDFKNSFEKIKKDNENQIEELNRKISSSKKVSRCEEDLLKKRINDLEQKERLIKNTIERLEGAFQSQGKLIEETKGILKEVRETFLEKLKNLKENLAEKDEKIKQLLAEKERINEKIDLGISLIDENLLQERENLDKNLIDYQEKTNQTLLEQQETIKQFIAEREEIDKRIDIEMSIIHETLSQERKKVEEELIGYHLKTEEDISKQGDRISDLEKLFREEGVQSVEHIDHQLEELKVLKIAEQLTKKFEQMKHFEENVIQEKKEEIISEVEEFYKRVEGLFVRKNDSLKEMMGIYERKLEAMEKKVEESNKKKLTKEIKKIAKNFFSESKQITEQIALEKKQNQDFRDQIHNYTKKTKEELEDRVILLKEIISKEKDSLNETREGLISHLQKKEKEISKRIEKFYDKLNNLKKEGMEARVWLEELTKKVKKNKLTIKKELENTSFRTIVSPKTSRNKTPEKRRSKSFSEQRDKIELEQNTETLSEGFNFINSPEEVWDTEEAIEKEKVRRSAEQILKETETLFEEWAFLPEEMKKFLEYIRFFDAELRGISGRKIPIEKLLDLEIKIDSISLGPQEDSFEEA